MKRPTQQDVADLAGVSRGTVSVVLNGQNNGRVPISEETQARVVEAAEKLGYAPNAVAQMLAKGQNYIIGVFVYSDLFPYEKTDYFFPYLTGIEQAAIREDYNVLLFTRNHHQPSDPHIYRNSMNTLRLADGCIIMGNEPRRDELARLQDENYPFVYIGRRQVSGCDINWVVSDYRTGAVAAVEALLRLDHKKFGFVTGGRLLEPQEDKLAGCREALSTQPDTSLAVLSFDTPGSQQELIDQVRTKKITALLCDSDGTMHQTVETLLPQGILMPRDLSIVSLTTAEYIPQFGFMPTHVELNRRAIGEKAAEILIKLVAGDVEAPQQIRMPVQFIAGETIGPCPQ